MSLPAESARRLARYWAARARLLLIGVTMENVVFRREVGMDPFGRLRRGSPLYWAHGLMAGWLVLQALLLAFGGWGMMIAACAVLLVLLTLGTQPFAAIRAGQSLSGDRRSGVLEEMSLTSMTPEEVFDGKFFGLLAPLIEVRRYLMIVGALVCWGVWRLAPGPWFLLALALWLTGMNHIGHSLHLGTLAGIKWGLIGEAGAGRMLRDWRLNPWPDHVWLHLKVGLVVGLPLAFLLWLGTTNPWTFFSAFGLLLVVPFYCAVNLAFRQQAEYERMRSMFRSLLNLEGRAGD